MSAEAPALTLAAHAVSGGTARERSAAEYFRRMHPNASGKLTSAAKMSRGPAVTGGGARTVRQTAEAERVEGR